MRLPVLERATPAPRVRWWPLTGAGTILMLLLPAVVVLFICCC